MHNRSSFEESMTNPLVRRVSNYNCITEERATYQGIYRKVAFFIGMVIAGVAAAFVLHSMYAERIYTGVRNEYIEISMVELAALAISGILYFICSLVAAFAPGTCKVTGTIACGSVGLMLGCMVNMLKEYREPAFLALVITILLVISMWLVYTNGYINVNGRFRTLMMTVLFTWVLSGIALFIFSFIPGLNAMVSVVMNNPMVALACAGIGVVIAAFFLLLDFDSIVMTVEDGLPRKYEWMAAYGLAFGIIWLYFKVLNLLIEIRNNKR